MTLFEGMKPNIVPAEHGWWLPEMPGEDPWLHGVWDVNIKVLLAVDLDLCNRLTGAYPLKTSFWRV